MMIVREGENGYKRVWAGSERLRLPQLREVRHYALLVCAGMAAHIRDCHFITQQVTEGSFL